MQLTQLTLLQQLSDGNESAWYQADSIYRPMIGDWLGRFGLQDNDRDDLTQDVMATFAREIGRFEHRGKLGSFRAWLKTITVNRAREFFRNRKHHPIAQNGTRFHSMIDELSDTTSEISRQFDRSHDAYVVRRLLAEIAPEFSEQTIAIFRLHVLEGRHASIVAEQNGVTRWSVYQAKSRVLRRLRERIGPWAEEMYFG